MPRVRFPKKFMWGASISAHQAEGGHHNQWTEWELENAKSLATRAHYQYGDLGVWQDVASLAKRPGNYVSARASGHRQVFRDDFDRLQQLHMNTLRFSIEWSRLEPEEGVWDAEAIAYYKEYFAELSRRRITPIVTLFHFTLPVWFQQKGGFTKRGNVKDFLRYVDKVLDEFATSLSWVITINEPEIYAYESYGVGHWPPMQSSRWTMLRVIENLLYVHKQAARRIHGRSRKLKVSMAYNIAYNYAGDTARLSGLSAGVLRMISHYVLWRSHRSIDFIGLNFYFSNRVYGYRVHNPNQRLSDLGWDMQPADLRYVLEDLADTYDKMPIIITENGLADGNDTQRQWWLSQTIQAMYDAMAHGVPLLGYCHWSLLDNFEWDKGRWPRFGLYSVNYATMERTVRPSAVALGKIIKQMRGV